MKIEIEVVGTFCNSWPNMIVEINGEKIHDGFIEGDKIISMDFNRLLERGNKFVIGMDNKSFGRNKIWDTKTRDNKIIEDKTLKVRSVKLDDVECKDLFHGRFYVKRSHEQPSYFPDVVESEDTMNYNGYFCFGFDLPLYNSIILSKFKNPSAKEISYFSNYTKVFHYEGEKKIIEDIKNILKEVDEKFSNKRTKIRNS